GRPPRRRRPDSAPGRRRGARRRRPAGDAPAGRGRDRGPGRPDPAPRPQAGSRGSWKLHGAALGSAAPRHYRRFMTITPCRERVSPNGEDKFTQARPNRHRSEPAVSHRPSSQATGRGRSRSSRRDRASGRTCRAISSGPDTVNTMTRLRLTTLLAISASALALAACGGGAEVASPGEGDFGDGGNGGGNGGDPTDPPPGTPAADCPTGFANVGLIANDTLRVCQLPQQIEGNLTVPLRAGTIYAINGRTSVGTDRGVDPAAPTAGSTQGILTIEAGVRIFASSGNDYLLINRGSQIFAEGTASSPIVFTSRQNVEGTTTATSQGQWGGIVIAGRAPQANCQLTAPVTCTGQVEGTSAFYGGNVPTDNSGRLRYVQIKYSGFEISTGNELQALTLAGVGSGTTVEYVQSYNSSDD